jgi:hypothetical protein
MLLAVLTCAGAMHIKLRIALMLAALAVLVISLVRLIQTQGL